MLVTTLAAEDAPAYRELMLEAYALAADSFTSTAEERWQEPMAWWVNRITSPNRLSESYGVFDADEFVGTVALEYTIKPKTRHSALVLSMYVRPSARRLGAGTLLMKAATSAARSKPSIPILPLTVTKGNDPALRLYQSVGFIAGGTEPLAISTPNGDKGKVHTCPRPPDTEPAAYQAVQPEPQAARFAN